MEAAKQKNQIIDEVRNAYPQYQMPYLMDPCSSFSEKWKIDFIQPDFL